MTGTDTDRGAAAERERCIATLRALQDQSGVNDNGQAWLVRLTRGDCVAALVALGPPIAADAWVPAPTALPERDEDNEPYTAERLVYWLDAKYARHSEYEDKAAANMLRALAAPTAERAHPTLEQCEAAGRGPENRPGLPYSSGGLPDTPEERARFEAYLRGHCWDIGHFDAQVKAYDTVLVRCLYGVWRDRGALAAKECAPTAAALAFKWPDFMDPAQGPQFPRCAPSAAPPAALTELSDTRILHLWDTHVGDFTPAYPFGTTDAINFARAVLAAAKGHLPPPKAHQRQSLRRVAGRIAIQTASATTWQIAGYAGLIDYPARWDTTKYPTLELAVRWALANYADTDGGPNPTLRDLLDEVRSTFTRDDDLPNGLLQRIDEALD